MLPRLPGCWCGQAQQARSTRGRPEGFSGELALRAWPQELCRTGWSAVVCCAMRCATHGVLHCSVHPSRHCEGMMQASHALLALKPHLHHKANARRC